MIFGPTFDGYYGQLVRCRRTGQPTVREARVDYDAAMNSANRFAAFAGPLKAF